MRKFYANYGPSLGRCCYTRSPFSSSLAAGVRLVVYITRCADCVYLNYLNIYPGYRLFFSPSSFFKKDWTQWETCLIVYDAFGVLAFYELYTLRAHRQHEHPNESAFSV